MSGPVTMYHVDPGLDPNTLPESQQWDFTMMVGEVSALKYRAAAHRALNCTGNYEDSKNMLSMAFNHLHVKHGHYQNNSLDYFFSVSVSVLDDLLLQRQEQEDSQCPSTR